MKRINLLILVLIGLFCSSTFLSAQQTSIFNQYIYQPFLFNPAMAGGKKSGENRLAMAYRGQWLGFDGNDSPKTALLSYDGAPLKNQKNSASVLGIGAFVLHDRAHTIVRTNFSISLAAHLPVGQYSKFSLGLRGGGLSHGYDFSTIKRADPDDPVLLQNATSSSFLMDLGGGINFNYDGPKFGANIGAATFQFPTEINLTDSLSFNINTHLLGSLSLRFNVSESELNGAKFYKLGFEPTVLYRSTLGRNIGGGNLDVGLKTYLMNAAWVGVGYRTNSSGLHFSLGITPSHNLEIIGTFEMQSDLGNSFEAGITYTIGKKKPPILEARKEQKAIDQARKDKEQQEAEEARELAKAIAEKQKAEAAEAERLRKEEEARLKREQEEAAAKAKAAKEAAEAKAKADKEAAEAKAKAAKEAAEAKAKADKEAAEAKAKADKEAADLAAKNAAEKAKAEREAAEAKAKADKATADAKAKAEKEAAEKAQKDAIAKAKADKEAAEAKAKAEREAAEAKAKADKEAAELASKDAAAKAKAEKEAAEAKAKAEKEAADAATKSAEAEKAAAAAKAKAEKEAAEAKAKADKEAAADAKAKTDKETAAAKAKADKEAAEAAAQAEKDRIEAAKNDPCLTLDDRSGVWFKPDAMKNRLSTLDLDLDLAEASYKKEDDGYSIEYKYSIYQENYSVGEEVGKLITEVTEVVMDAMDPCKQPKLEEDLQGITLTSRLVETADELVYESDATYDGELGTNVITKYSMDGSLANNIIAQGVVSFKQLAILKLISLRNSLIESLKAEGKIIPKDSIRLILVTEQDIDQEETMIEVFLKTEE